MSTGLSDVVRTTFLGGLGTLDALLKAAEAHASERDETTEGLLAGRLAADMFTFTQQVQTATDNARRVTDRLLGGEPSSRPDPEATVTALRERVRETIEHVTSADAAAIDASAARAMKIDLGAGPMDFTGRSYALGFALPNFSFHVAMAYAILRHHGVPLGKIAYIAPFIAAGQQAS